MDHRVVIEAGQRNKNAEEISTPGENQDETYIMPQGWAEDVQGEDVDVSVDMGAIDDIDSTDTSSGKASFEVETERPRERQKSRLSLSNLYSKLFVGNPPTKDEQIHEAIFNVPSFGGRIYVHYGKIVDVIGRTVLPTTYIVVLLYLWIGLM